MSPVVHGLMLLGGVLGAARGLPGPLCDGGKSDASRFPA
jgi:hypothetical protein